MDLISTILPEKENAAIDMTITLVVSEIAEILRLPERDVLPEFLQSKTCEMLYNRKEKLWCEGPSGIVDRYLAEKGYEANSVS